MNTKPTILVADDDGLLARSLNDALSRTGYEVSVVHDGKAALEKALAVKPELILLDYQMPEMNGLEVLKALRDSEEGKDIEVVFSTNTYDTSVINEALGLGVHDYVLKADISLDQIVELVKKYVPLEH